MNARLSPALELGFQESGLDVAVLYDCLPSAQSAAHLLKRVTHRAGEEASLSLWKLDHFCLPQMREPIRADLLRASLVIVCCPQDLHLPETARLLLEQWASRRSSTPRALAAILSAPRTPRILHPDKSSILSFLKVMDESYPVSIFMDTVLQPADRDLSAGLPRGLHRHLPRRLQHSPDWGLNE